MIVKTLNLNPAVINKLDIPSHIQWLQNNFNHLLQKRVVEDGFDVDTDKIISVMASADPSQKKGAVDWLVKTYCLGGFRWEDIAAGPNSNAFKLLKSFGENRHRFVDKDKNLTSYKSLSDVWIAIESFQEQTAEVSSRELKRKERAEVMQQTKILYRSEEVIAAVPLTEDASKWWGRGTQWCTSAKENNYFNHYNKNAPLIILVFPKGLENSYEEKDVIFHRKGVRKLQLHCNEENTRYSLSFMDENDKPVSPLLVWSNYRVFEPIVIALKKHYSLMFEYIDPEKRSYQDYLDCVSNYNFPSLSFIPGEMRTKELCRKFIEHGHASNSSTLQAFPKKLLDEQTILSILRANIRNACAYGFEEDKIPVFKSIQWNKWLKVAADKVYDQPINGVNFHVDTKQCFAFKETRDYARNMFKDFIKSIPRVLVTEKLFKRLLDLNPAFYIYNIPPKYINQEICDYALERDDRVISLIPERFLTDAIVKKYLAKNGLLLDQLSNRGWNITKKLCSIAIENSGYALQYVPEPLRTLEMCEVAISKANCLKHVPREYQTPEFVEKAVRFDGSSLKFVKKILRTLELCWLAVKSNCFALEFCPPALLTPDLVQTALDANPLCILTLKQTSLTPEIILIVLKYDVEVWSKTPHSIRCNLDFVSKALKVNRGVIKYLSPEIIEAIPAAKQISLELLEYERNAETDEPATNFLSEEISSVKWQPEILEHLSSSFNKTFAASAEQTGILEEAMESDDYLLHTT